MTTVSPRKPAQHPAMRLAAVDGQRCDDARAFAGEALVIGRPNERTIEPGGLDVQAVPRVDSGEIRVDPRREPFAQREIGAAGRIDRDAELAAPRTNRARCCTISTPSKALVVRDRIEFALESRCNFALLIVCSSIALLKQRSAGQNPRSF